METGHLDEFVYLAETLSFKQTAEHFFVSRSVISRHLVALEETIGAKLIDRGGKSVKLTEAGHVFYRDARVILRDCASAIDNVRAVQESSALTVRVGYLRNAARPVIVYFVRFMHEMHPGVRFALSCMEFGELKRAMEDGTVDIAIAIDAAPDMKRRYRSTQIYTDRFFAVMSKENPLNEKVGKNGLQLADMPEDKLLLPDSFVYAGMNEVIGRLMASKTQKVAREYYSDIDMLYLKVQTEDYVALSSGMNNMMFGSSLTIAPIVDVDTRFSVYSFFRDGMENRVFAMCRGAFEACRDEIKKRDLMGGSKTLPVKGFGFTFEHFE